MVIRRLENIRTSPLLKSDKIFKRIREIWEDFLSFRLQYKKTKNKKKKQKTKTKKKQTKKKTTIWADAKNFEGV